jgi:predicted flap endonuclease-1-like 5' DNA nuclease
MIQQNWLVFAAVAFVALLILIWLIGRASKPADRQREHRPDVLDEGAAPAARNQALIDSPTAMTPFAMTQIAMSAVPATTIVDPLGGMGETAAAQGETWESNAEAAQWEAAELAESRAESVAADAIPNDLGRLKGVGPKLVALLGTLGITRYDQIAGWSDADIDRVDAQLGPFQGRIRRDDWVEQARLLASGDTDAYEARFGKLS